MALVNEGLKIEYKKEIQMTSRTSHEHLKYVQFNLYPMRYLS